MWAAYNFPLSLRTWCQLLKSIFNVRNRGPIFLQRKPKPLPLRSDRRSIVTLLRCNQVNRWAALRQRDIVTLTRWHKVVRGTDNAAERSSTVVKEAGAALFIFELSLLIRSITKCKLRLLPLCWCSKYVTEMNSWPLEEVCGKPLLSHRALYSQSTRE